MVMSDRARAQESAVPSATWQGTRGVRTADQGAESGATTSTGKLTNLMATDKLTNLMSTGKLTNLMATGKLTNLMATDADLIGRIAWFVWVLACWSWSLASLPLVIATPITSDCL